MKSRQELISWLLEGDAAIQFQVHRDIVQSPSPLLGQLQKRIPAEGWGQRILSLQNSEGHWGRGYYQPKWTSTHYTLTDLKGLCIPRNNHQAVRCVNTLLKETIDNEGSVNFSPRCRSDVCINGMVLSFGAYFQAEEESLCSIIEYLLDRQMSDGGWNCEDYRGATHSSLHTTISVLEGLLELDLWGYRYRQPDRKQAAAGGRSFILTHSLFLSDTTGEIIDKRYLMLSYPSRWRYDILRSLEYFRNAEIGYDPRMQPAIDTILKKRRQDGTWPLQLKHPGAVHFDMEKPGEPSRWNTLRALRTLEHFGLDIG